MEQLKHTATDKAINALLSLASRGSDADMGRLLSLLEFITSMTGLDPHAKDLIRSVRQQWREDRPFARFLKRFLHEISPRCRERLVANFVLNNAWGPVAARRQALADEEGFYPPFTYLLSPTMRCNLRCTGCYAGDYSREDELPFEMINRVLNEGKEMGIYFVTILGGEPFMRSDMWDLYEGHSDVIFQVFTNGTLLDEMTAERLATLGNVVPVLSLEGFEEGTDARRGKGTYERVIHAMELLHKAGVPFGFSSMVTRQNLETIISDEFNDMLIAKGALFGWHFLYMPVGRDPDLESMPTAEQRDRLRREGAARLRETRPIFVADFWNDAPYVGGCIAGGRNYFHINSRGDAEPCIFAHFAVDNVKQKSLREILRSPFFRAIRARQPFSDNLLRPCMLIDHPWVFREIHSQEQPYATHTDAVAMVSTLCSDLDRYSQETERILERAWQDDFVARGFSPALAPLDTGAPDGAEATLGKGL